MSDVQRAALEGALGAQYEIIRLLGRGGMASVYLGREQALERLVAIKVLPPQSSGDDTSRERFRREARTAANLTHPNIVPLYTFGEADDMLYFVMGYVRGESLGARLRRDGKIPPAETRRILSELATALDYAHRRGVVHRDIKPDNVLLDDDSGRPMLTDFGVAKAQATGATLTHAGVAVGTPHYMSPEQASGDRAVDGRSDLYALGVMGYAMLAGRLPFEGETMRDVLVQHAMREPISLRSLAPGVPADLETAITRALVKDPSGRWADGRTMALALGEGGSEDEDDGDSEIPLTGSGTLLLGFIAAGGTVAAVVAVTHLPGGRGFWLVESALTAVLPTIAFAGVALYRRLCGDSWHAIVSRFMLPLARWRSWWPKRWRRRGDVWDRLPAPVRKAKLLLTASNMLTPVFAVVAAATLERTIRDVFPPVSLVMGFLATYAVVLAPAIYSNVVLSRWTKGIGLSRADRTRVMRAPLADRDFWKKSKFAALLSRTPDSDIEKATVEPRMPRDFLAAIAELSSQLVGPLRDVGADVLVAARQSVAAIDALDAELATLARDADPAEIAAVEQKLKALGEPQDGEPASRRQVRNVVSGQLDLLRRLRAQSIAAGDRRAHLAELLKTLWLQLAKYRADAAAESLAAHDITGEIRALCEEVDRQAAADAAVRSLLE